MIKRRFYRVEHGEKDGASSDSSSSSSDDSEVEPQVSDTDDDVEDDATVDVNDDVDDADEEDDEDDSSALKPQYPSSGYESEDSSGNEVDVDTTGLITRADESESESDGDPSNDIPATLKENTETLKEVPEDLPVAENFPSCVLKNKGAYKCRLCPKIVCFKEESLMAHLKSKRHARSEKLLNDGRLKRFLNSDGEEEEVTDDDGETHAERHARILAIAQSQDLPKKAKGRQRQRQRSKRKKEDSTDVPKTTPQQENRAKRRRKSKEDSTEVPKTTPQRENRAKRRRKSMD